MKTASIACQQLVELVTEYLEDTLTPAQQQAVQDHFTACADCSEYLAQMRQVIALSRRLGTHPDASALPPGILEQLMRAFRQRPGL